MAEQLLTKDDVLNKLRAYGKNPDDDVIRIKKQIRHILLRSPELLYALHVKDLESELFSKDGSINWEWIVFTIFVHGGNRIDPLTGIARHDLIAGIIREKFAWIGLEISTTTPVYNKESTTDNNYVVRTLKYECTLPNDLVETSNGRTFYKNKRW